MSTRRSSTRVCAEALETRTLLAIAGTLDNSFSGDGKATIDFGAGVTVNASDVAVQSDAKTVVVGRSSSGDFAVARFSFDGTPDTSFGPNHNGKVLTHVGSSTTKCFSNTLAIQSDGKIVVAGEANDNGAVGIIGIARYMPNGSLDTTFSGDGKQTFSPADSRQSFGTSIAIQKDGEILVAGFAIGTSDANWVIARFKPNGSTDGRTFVDFGKSQLANAITIDNTGTPSTNPFFGDAVVVGDGPGFGGNPQTFGIARLKPGGGLDTRFGLGGKVLLSFPGDVLQEAPGSTLGGRDVLVQSNGKIVVCGTIATAAAPSDRNFALFRLKATGELDVGSFGGLNGPGFTTLDIANDDRATSMIQSSDGGILVGGNSDGQFAIAKFTAQGGRDGTFGTNGIVRTNFGFAAGVTGLARVPLTKRFVAAGGNAFATARYLDTGAGTVVSVGALDPDATEGAGDNGAVIVARTERLAVPTRVFLNITGTAKFSPFSILTNDYSVTGLKLPGFNSTDFRPFVDIPANQTFVILPLIPRDDTAIEGDETAIFSIASDPSYEIGIPGSGQVDIHDNDTGVKTDLKGVTDSYVRDGTFADTNFSSAADLQVKTDGTGFNRLSYIKFDISSVGTISSAKLDLFGKLVDTQSTSVGVSVFPVADNSWTGPTITFNNKPAPGPTALSSVTVTGTTLTLYEFDVTNYVKQEKALGHNLVSFQLRAPVSAASVVSFNSGNAASNTPKLSVLAAAASPGTFTIAPLPKSVKVGQEVKLDVTWTVPSGGWPGLEWIKLLLRDVDDQGSFAIIKFEELRRKFYLMNPAGVTSSPITLVLNDCTFKAAGPTSPTVTLTYAFKFNSSAAGHRFAVDVSGRNDDHERSGFSPTGVISVKAS